MVHSFRTWICTMVYNFQCSNHKAKVVSIYRIKPNSFSNIFKINISINQELNSVWPKEKDVLLLRNWFPFYHKIIYLKQTSISYLRCEALIYLIKMFLSYYFFTFMVFSICILYSHFWNIKWEAGNRRCYWKDRQSLCYKELLCHKKDSEI